MDRTWTKFKCHFTIAQQYIKNSQSQQNVEDLGFHKQSNEITLAKEVYDRFATEKADEESQGNGITAEQAAEKALHK